MAEQEPPQIPRNSRRAVNSSTFLFAWVLATALGTLVILFPFSNPQGSGLGDLIALAVAGLVMAVLQASALRANTGRNFGWVVPTTLGWGIAVLILAVPAVVLFLPGLSLFSSDQGGSAPTASAANLRAAALLYFTALAALTGLIVSLSQWIAMRNKFNLSPRWIPMSVLAWALGGGSAGAIAFFAYTDIVPGMSGMWHAVLGFLVGGTLIGVVTAIPMLAFLKQHGALHISALQPLTLLIAGAGVIILLGLPAYTGPLGIFVPEDQRAVKRAVRSLEANTDSEYVTASFIQGIEGFLAEYRGDDMEILYRRIKAFAEGQEEPEDFTRWWRTMAEYDAVRRELTDPNSTPAPSETADLELGELAALLRDSALDEIMFNNYIGLPPDPSLEELGEVRTQLNTFISEIDKRLNGLEQMTEILNGPPPADDNTEDRVIYRQLKNEMGHLRQERELLAVLQNQYKKELAAVNTLELKISSTP